MSVTRAKEAMADLGKKAKDVWNDDKLSMAEKKTALEKIETDIKKHSDEIATYELAQKLSGAGESPNDAKAKAAAEADERAAKGVSFADQVIESAFFKNFRTGVRAAATVEVKDATSIAEGTAASGYGMDGNAGQLVTPNFLPGIVDLRMQRLTIADLFAQGSTSSPLISYAVETVWNDHAAAVAEGGLKPLSDGKFARVNDQVGKIANRLKMTDEMVQDIPAARTFLQNRLVWSIQREEEKELLNGTGYPGLKGVLKRDGLLAPVTASKADALTLIDSTYDQITALRSTSFVEPDAFVIHPDTWAIIAKAKDKNGQYYAGGPFSVGAYGGGLKQASANMWGLPGVVTSAIDPGQILLGGFQENGQLFRRQGVTVEMTNSNEDDFNHNLISVRAEERAALAVYRPQGFGLVTVGA